METNLSSNKTDNQDNWALTFGLTLDILWRTRNELVFNQSHCQPLGVVHMIKKVATEVLQSQYMHGKMMKHQKDINMEPSICWKPPDTGFVKVNCDGAMSHDPRTAACGGVIRDERGNTVVAYAKYLGERSSLHAELWAIYYGVKLAKECGFSKLNVESDSILAINFMNKGCMASPTCHSLVRAILNLCNDGMLVSWNHTLREANQVMDALSKYGLSMDAQYRVFDVIPSIIALPILADVSSTHFPRVSSCWFLGF